VQALTSLIQRAKDEGGSCYCALYELQDPELLQALLNKEYVHLILANSATDPKTKKKDATNADARSKLHHSSTDITNRMLSGNHIGHNKFVVYVDKSGEPQAVLTGSTNWTSTGLCAQANNSLIIDSPELAKKYLDYWHQLKADKAQQAPALRDYDRNNPAEPPAPAAAQSLKVWFSPNTTQKTKPKKDPPRPVDMSEVFDAIAGAQHAVLFLAFIPGSPSIMDAIHNLQTQKPHLFIRGAVSDPKTVQLYHRKGDRADARVVSVAGINDQFGSWTKELYKLGHAVIHDKIVVVDPLSENCVVITGSHNLGYKASYCNDENMVIIRGDLDVAAAYATHVLDIYDHYRWRYNRQLASKKQTQKKAWSCLKTLPSWQDFYYQADNPARREIEFWAG
jgi:phosphatidylserine/phosphatidylglycerophosphate/cardiolipin synthase-like enzyme